MRQNVFLITQSHTLTHQSDCEYECVAYYREQLEVEFSPAQGCFVMRGARIALPTPSLVDNQPLPPEKQLLFKFQTVKHFSLYNLIAF